MSRFNTDGYDDLEGLLAYGRFEGRRKKVLNGKPGKAALAELEKALLALPHKRLIEGSLCDGKGVCAIGAWMYHQYRDQGLEPRDAWFRVKREGRPPIVWQDSEYSRTVEVGSKALGITETLAEVVALVNDEESYARTPEERYQKVLAWVQRHKALEATP